MPSSLLYLGDPVGLVNSDALVDIVVKVVSFPILIVDLHETDYCTLEPKEQPADEGNVENIIQAMAIFILRVRDFIGVRHFIQDDLMSASNIVRIVKELELRDCSVVDENLIAPKVVVNLVLVSVVVVTGVSSGVPGLDNNVAMTLLVLLNICNSVKEAPLVNFV